MKILLISNSSKSILNFRSKIIDCFLRCGYEVVVLIPESDLVDISVIEKIKAKGCFVESFYLNRAGVSVKDDAKSFFDILKIIKKQKPTHVLNYTIKPIIYGSIAARTVGVKNIYSLITGIGYAFNNIEEFNYKPKFFQKIVFNLYRIALLCCKRVIFQNIDDQKLFNKLNIVQLDKTDVVNGSGVDLSHYNYDLNILKNYTLELPIKFLMLGRIIGDKGIREYVQAAKYLKKKYGKQVIFQLAGGLDSNPSAIQKEELDDWINSGAIEYLGRLNDVRPAITDSHIFVLPSYREGTSRSILEAMSIGRPIITTNVAGCKQLVEVGRNGYLAEAKSVESLIEAIEKTLKLSSSDLVDMGVFSRKIVEDKYDVHKVNEHMLDIMDIK